jgi:hypothetical protein
MIDALLDLIQAVSQLPYAPWVILGIFFLGILSLLNALVEIAIYALSLALLLMALSMGYVALF